MTLFTEKPKKIRFIDSEIVKEVINEEVRPDIWTRKIIIKKLFERLGLE